jgi:CBS domain-containing protein
MTTAPVIGAQAPIGRIASRLLATVPPEATLREVLVELATEEIGVVLVRAEHGVAGVLGERDLVQALADDIDPDATQAVELVSAELVTAPEDTPIAEVGRLMVDTGVRHVLVGPAERPTAIISMRDVLAVLLGTGAPPVSP